MHTANDARPAAADHSPIGAADNDDDHDQDLLDEIPIWICGEPRYISGITDTTTCRDIIQALIDDELMGGEDDDEDEVTGAVSLSSAYAYHRQVNSRVAKTRSAPKAKGTDTTPK